MRQRRRLLCSAAALAPVKPSFLFSAANNSALSSHLRHRHLLPLRRYLALPCPSSFSDSDSSAPVDELISTTTIDLPLFSSDSSAEPIAYRSKQSFSTKYHRTIKRVKAVLSRRGCDLSWEKSSELDEHRVISILHELFDNAPLAHDFFRLSRRRNRSEHGVRVLCTMAHIFVFGNMNHNAVRFLRRVVCAGSSSQEWQKMVFDVLLESSRSRRVLEIVCSMLVLCYKEEGMLEIAVQLVNRMKNLALFPTLKAYNSLIACLLDSKQMNLAWEVFVGMPTWYFGSNEEVISLFIREFCAYGSFDSACKLLFQMPEYGGKADVVAYTMVINAFCKRGLLREATLVFYKMLECGVSHDSVLISSVVDGYCKAGKLAEAAGLWASLSDIPDVYVFNSFISRLCREGNMVEAYQIFNEINEAEVYPDSYIYTTLIDGYCKACQIEEAFKLYALMLKRGVKATISTYTALLDGCCKREDLSGAERILHAMKMEGTKPDVVTYNVMINGYCKNGHMHKAYELKDLMEKDGVSADIITYNILMHGLIRRGFIMESREMFNELIRRGFSPDRDAFTNVINICSKEGNLHEAFLIWCSMSDNGVKPDVVTCSALLNCFCKKQRMQDANILFHKMLDSGLKPDLILYNTLICGFCREGNITEVYKLLNKMNENGIVPSYVTYKALVLCLEKMGVENAAERASMKMQNTFTTSGICYDGF